ncbi:hypothetical protein ACJMK2_014543 [Sinanodonta woodiana]|uniref:lysoplasmalogenase n=1 Tax=Sinanodonta woodiana TaxID=1069815 RepID=A0ABD3V1C6_SINWO
MQFTNVMSQMDNKIYVVMFIVSTIFFVWHYDLYEKNPPETVTAAFLKAFPIISLAGYVAAVKAKKMQLKEHTHLLSFVIAGLLTSSLGDICLIFSHHLFFPGMLLFAITHCCYAVAFGKHTGGLMTKIVFILIWMTGFIFIQSKVTSYIMKVLILGYSALLFNTGWRSTAIFESERTIGAFFGFLGTISFMSSDSLIAIDTWVIPIPRCEFLIMVTYYCGQLGIALGTTQRLYVKSM